MVRTKLTARKSTAGLPPAVRARNRFYTYYMDDQQDFVEFLTGFRTRWAAASEYGVTAWDGMMQLVEVLPADWRPWVETIIPDYIAFDPEGNILETDLQGLIDAIIAQQFAAGGPPDTPPYEVHPDDAEFMMMLDGPEFDPETASVVDSNSTPTPPHSFLDMESPFADSENLFDVEPCAADSDLYRQPYVWDVTPPLDNLNSPTLSSVLAALIAKYEAGPSQPSGVIRNRKYDPEFIVPVGTISLQPLSLNEMPFVTDPYILENIPEVCYHSQLGEGPPPGFECVEERSEEEVAENDQSTVLHFHHIEDGTAEGNWRVTRGGEDDQILPVKKRYKDLP